MTGSARKLGYDRASGPIIFIVVMTTMFKDVHDNLNLKEGTISELDFTEILYADDMVLFTNNVTSMNRLLETWN